MRHERVIPRFGLNGSIDSIEFFGEMGSRLCPRMNDRQYASFYLHVFQERQRRKQRVLKNLPAIAIPYTHPPVADRYFFHTAGA